MILATNLGFPRIGAKRELKRSLEKHWAGEIDQRALESTALELRARHWKLQVDAGLNHIPSNDFSLYDHVLDTAVMVGAVPKRFDWNGDTVDLDTYFRMARGGGDVAALEMTKWFDTNYHYIVPEFEKGLRFRLAGTKPVDQFIESKRLGVHTRPVLLGPVSFLLLGKLSGRTGSPLGLLPELLPVYQEILSRLVREGADWIQIDEPGLALDPVQNVQEAYRMAYAELSQVSPRLRILLTTYFGDLGVNLPLAVQLPVAGLHLDLVRALPQVDRALELIPKGMSLSLGLIDGRNIWRADLFRPQVILNYASGKLGTDRLMVAPSCSLLHVPIDLEQESRLDPEIRGWLAFATQKLEEVVALARSSGILTPGARTVLEKGRNAVEQRRSSARIHLPSVKVRVAGADPKNSRRLSPFPARREIQQGRLKLPLFPTTTIGSFPQTLKVRSARAEFRAKKLGADEYSAFLRGEMEKTVRFQETAGLDVLVHGEFERNDMVEHFAEVLQGFAITAQGWVQSYGSRCVKPPILYGDVARPEPMTVRWIRDAQSLTDRPVKGMLTGPVTILQWSFVRDDQPRSETCRQIAFAIRDEVVDLEAAGIRIIQIDEPALREGLPLRRADWAQYLSWAVESFRISSCGVRDETQIHTHMCYSEFNDIIEAIADMDADVCTIESSRSKMEILGAFHRFRYPNAVGPGVYDIHSPRVPGDDEMLGLLRRALEQIPAEGLWVNPDCGLKTRGWKEVESALKGMVRAARSLREEKSRGGA